MKNKTKFLLIWVLTSLLCSCSTSRDDDTSTIDTTDTIAETISTNTDVKIISDSISFDQFLETYQADLGSLENMRCVFENEDDIKFNDSDAQILSIVIDFIDAQHLREDILAKIEIDGDDSIIYSHMIRDKKYSYIWTEYTIENDMPKLGMKVENDSNYFDQIDDSKGDVDELEYLRSYFWDINCYKVDWLESQSFSIPEDYKFMDLSSGLPDISEISNFDINNIDIDTSREYDDLLDELDDIWFWQ